MVADAVLKSLQQVFTTISLFGRQFIQKQLDSYSEDKKKAIAAKRRELNKVNKRIAEIDRLIQKIYEDNDAGRLSDERYETLASAYEDEQRKLKASVPELEAFISTETDKTANMEQLVAKVKGITRPKELTPELVHEFIEKIVVSEARYVDGKRVQIMDIYYNGVGVIRGFSPEEQEEIFERGIERRKKEKTA